MSKWFLLIALVVLSSAGVFANNATDPRLDLFGGIIIKENDLDKWHAGQVKSIGDYTLTVEGMNFPPDALKGKVICPNFDRPLTTNRYSNHYYRIVSNTGDTIQTDPEDGKLTDFARKGDDYLLAGFFHLAQLNQRWVMMDPLDHPFITMGPCVMTANNLGYLPKKLLKKKYGTVDQWWETAVPRLKGMGWTSTMGYAENGLTDQGYLKPMLPYWRIVRSVDDEGMRQMQDGRGWLESPFKNILDGIYDKYGEKFPDVFDPNLGKAYGKGIEHGWGPDKYAANDPWVIGYITEESDNLCGLLKPNFSLGWCSLACKPTQDKSTQGIVYSDPKVYTKAALADFLKGKYQTIDALNHAWGSSYTTFASDGGWGKGKGLLDEDGNLGMAWLGKPIRQDYSNTWEGANETAKKDLLEFQTRIVERFYSTLVKGLKSHSPNHLVMGNCDNTPCPDDYFAESRWVDATFSPPPDSVMQLADTGRNVIKACLATAYMSAEEDSPLGKLYTGGDNDPWREPGTFWKTQKERGQAYFERYTTSFDLRAANGTRPTIGMIWWSWGDDSNEKRNWGVCTYRDNLYDGKEATTAGADGIKGTWDDEEKDYGDCVTMIRKANAEVVSKLVSEELTGKAPATESKLPLNLNQSVPDKPN